MNLHHLARLARLGALPAMRTLRLRTTAPQLVAMRAHEPAGAIETSLAIAEILRTEAGASSLACATHARRADSTASTNLGATGATSATRAAHSAHSAHAWAGATHRWRRWKVVSLLDADDLWTRELRLLARAELRTDRPDHARA